MPPSKLPSQWQSFFVGRRVRHPDLPGVSGVVKYAHCTRVGEQDAERIAALGVSIRTAFAVDWDDGSREVMEDSEVAKVATDEFVKEEWVMEKILALQACNWDEAKADAAIAEGQSFYDVPRAAGAGPSKSKAKAKTAANPGPRSPKQPAGGSGMRVTTLAELKRKHGAAGEGGTPTATPKKKARASPAAPAASGAGADVAASARASACAPPEEYASSTGLLDPAADSAAALTAASPARQRRQPAATGARGKAAAGRPPLPPSPAALVGSGATIWAPKLLKAGLTAKKVSGVDVFEYDEVEVGGAAFRIYSADLVIAAASAFRPPADKPIAQWKVQGDYDASEEYLLEGIAAERAAPGGGGGKKKKGGAAQSGAGAQFLLKYARFELDLGPECWLPLAEVEETAAYDAWVNGGREGWREATAAVRAAAGLA